MKCRFRHSTVVYHCEGVQKDLPVVHYNDEKRKNMPVYIGISGKRNSTGTCTGVIHYACNNV